uniref:Uncharacterized protein n=1 Tax=Cyprinodon variegatus TaxID=28743 RepID=A0A3Q2GA50_CYPVA
SSSEAVLSEAEFDWQDYLQSTGSHAAPASLFTRRSTDCAFQVGMKLEAVDKKNPGLVCVASVADVQGALQPFLFRSLMFRADVCLGVCWSFRCDSSSPYIHPVGWCEEHVPVLWVPGHPSPEHFVWDDYLQETGSMAAPGAAFTLVRSGRGQTGVQSESF